MKKEKETEGKFIEKKNSLNKYLINFILEKDNDYWRPKKANEKEGQIQIQITGGDKKEVIRSYRPPTEDKKIEEKPEFFRAAKGKPVENNLPISNNLIFILFLNFFYFINLKKIN